MNATATAGQPPRSVLEAEIWKNRDVITSYLPDRSQANRFLALAVEAHAVYRNDVFEVELGTSAGIIHRPKLNDDRGPVVASYAVAQLKAGGTVREVCTSADLAKIRASSPASDKGPWQTWPERMAMKSAMRRLLKRLPAADIGTLARATAHVIEHDDPETGSSYQARIEPPTRSTSSPADTADLEARALQAVNEAGSALDLAQAWSGIKLEFKAAGADIQIGIEARWRDRRETLAA